MSCKVILFIKTFCKIKSELKNQPTPKLDKEPKRADALASAPNCISIYYLLFISAIAACAAASLAIGTLNGEQLT